MSEPLDANKTALTHTATATAAAWLEGIGCKPIESEVAVANGWVADLAAVWEPTFTEAKKTKLFKHIVPDGALNRDAWTRYFRHFGGRLTVILEVKTSRSDFCKDIGRKYPFWYADDAKRSMQPPAHMAILAAPSGVVTKDDLEHLFGWAHLELSANSERVLKGPRWHPANPLNPGQIENFLFALLTACDHRTRYARIRAWRKAWSAKAVEERLSKTAREARRDHESPGHEPATREAAEAAHRLANGPHDHDDAGGRAGESDA